jgi:putative ABC transport system permease protein
MSLVVRTRGNPAQAVRTVERAVARIDPRQPVYQVRAMTDLTRDILSPDRLNANLLGLFAGLALALAAIGIYGVLACEVGRRTHEIGVRMALGARGGQVLRDVVGEGLTLVVAGLGLGLAGALAASRLLRSLLFGIDAYDPLTFAGAAVVLLGAGLLACLLPARRALRVDPLIALRQE